MDAMTSGVIMRFVIYVKFRWNKKMKIQSYPYLHLGDKYFMRRVIKVYSLILGLVMMFMQGACYTSSGNSYI